MPTRENVKRHHRNSNVKDSLENCRRIMILEDDDKREEIPFSRFWKRLSQPDRYVTADGPMLAVYSHFSIFVTYQWECLNDMSIRRTR